MRIVIFSDSHGDVEACRSVIDKIPGIDMAIHTGDIISDIQKLGTFFPELDRRYVPGNCDFSALPSDLLFEVCGKKIFISHGHCYNVKNDSTYSKFKEKALSLGADMAVFGHTHKCVYENDGRLILINPGSIKYGRTFAIAEIEDGKIKADICDFSMWK